MSAGFTPGPWRVSEDWRSYDQIKASGGAGNPDCTIAETGSWGDGFKDEQHANARLIATAPELYEIGSAFNKLFEEMQGHVCEYLVPDGLDADKLISKLIYLLDGPEQRVVHGSFRNALAKVRGEQVAS